MTISSPDSAPLDSCIEMNGTSNIFLLRKSGTGEVACLQGIIWHSWKESWIITVFLNKLQQNNKPIQTDGYNKRV